MIHEITLHDGDLKHFSERLADYFYYQFMQPRIPGELVQTSKLIDFVESSTLKALTEHLRTQGYQSFRLIKWSFITDDEDEAIRFKLEFGGTHSEFKRREPPDELKLDLV